MLGAEDVMAEIIQFPDAAGRDWVIIRRAIADILKTGGLDDTAIDWISDDLKPRLLALKLERSIEAPAACEGVVRQLFDFIHEVSNHAMLELLKLEIALYQAKFRGRLP
jgi:hypothetical protein